MPPPAIIDLSRLDPQKLLYSREQIQELIPQRHEFFQLDGILHLDREREVLAGVRQIRPGEWWCRGHLPERPIFPGVLMIESAAQLAAFGQKMFYPEEARFMGFGALDEVKFRGMVEPPTTLILVGRHLKQQTRRRFVTEMQGYVEGSIVFQGVVTGIPLDT